jgi:hypothetical protein
LGDGGWFSWCVCASLQVTPPSAWSWRVVRIKLNTRANCLQGTFSLCYLASTSLIHSSWCLSGVVQDQARALLVAAVEVMNVTRIVSTELRSHKPAW